MTTRVAKEAPSAPQRRPRGCLIHENEAAALSCPWNTVAIAVSQLGVSGGRAAGAEPRKHG